MIISVVSGKGGAGKTTIATALAHILQADYYDLDVDAPNGEYFLQPQIKEVRSVFVRQPKIDSSICTACGTCAQQCRFKALYKIKDHVYLNEHLCHSCNLCREVCPAGAITYTHTSIGTVRSGPSAISNAQVIIGDLKIGSTRGTALIQDLTRQIGRHRPTVIDGPPGNSCAAVAAIKPADLVVLVIEPTPFGIHDMLQTLTILRDLQKPLVAVANKSLDDTELKDVLTGQGLALKASIGLKSEYHQTLLRGEVLSQSNSDVLYQLQSLVRDQVKEKC